VEGKGAAHIRELSLARRWAAEHGWNLENRALIDQKSLNTLGNVASLQNRGVFQSTLAWFAAFKLQ
jgi:hypothetical protein